MKTKTTHQTRISQTCSHIELKKRIQQAFTEMILQSAVLKFWLDFKNTEFSYTIVKYCPISNPFFYMIGLCDKEAMSLQTTFFLCQLTPSYSNNTGY